jgi:hypothetical protein
MVCRNLTKYTPLPHISPVCKGLRIIMLDEIISVCMCIYIFIYAHQYYYVQIM